MIPALLGCLFGLLGIFSIGVLFVPLAALCTLTGAIIGFREGQGSTLFVSAISGFLACVGFAVSPSMWLATAVLLAQLAPERHTSHNDAAAQTPAVTADSMAAAAAPPPRYLEPAGAVAHSPEGEGRADRQHWELWISGLVGDEAAGAIWWSGQRSLAHPGSCYAVPDGRTADWTRGCQEAQRLIAPFDVRRRAEPDYRAGWNSP